MRQSEKTPVLVQDAIDFTNDNGLQIGRFWVSRFVECNSETITFRQVRFLEIKWYKVSDDDLKRYFDAMAIHLQHAPSLFMSNADETRVGIAKKKVPQ
jgi:hypothetical protein